MSSANEAIRAKAEYEQEQRDRRDRFAAAALTGLLGSGKHGELASSAAYCRLVADALIAELDK
jgi:hypothetical protein